MNRYTQLSTTQFNPLSMEEMSILPAMMRQKHDQASLEMEKRRADLNAFAISSPEYSQEAQALIAQMNKGIDDLSGSLASNGYNSLTRTNLSNMNRDYQQLVSPTGRLGQMANAEKLNAERYKEHLAAAKDADQSSADAMRNWALNKQNYTGYDNEGNITAINSLGVPKYANMVTDLKDIKGILGESQRRVDSAGGGNIHIRNDGSAWVVNKSGSVQRITNDPQLTQALEFLKTKWLTPDGEGFKSAMYQGKNLNSIVSELNSGINAMRVDKIVDTTNYSGSLSGYKNPKDGDGSGAGGLGPYSSNLMNTGNRFDFSASKYPNKESVANRLKELGSDKSKMNDEQREEFDTLKAVESRYQEALLGNKDYQEAIKVINTSKAAINKSGAGKEPTDKSGKSTSNPNLSTGLDFVRLAAEGKKDPKLAEAVKTVQDIEKSTFQNLPTRVSSYVVPRSSNAKSNQSIQAADDNLLTIFRNGMGGIDNNMVIKSITNDDSDVYTYSKLGESTQQGIKGLLRNAKNVQILGTEVNPLTNKSELIVNIETDGKTKASLGWGRGTSGGAGNTTVRLELKNTENAVGVSTIMGNIANHYHNYGGPEGKVFASQIASSASKLKSNSDFEAAGFTYGHLNEYSSQMNPVTSRLVQDRILNALSAEKSMSIQDLQKLPTTQLNKLVNDYIDNHSQEQIILY